LEINSSIQGENTIFINPYIAENISTGWFDGAAQRIRALSGSGGMIKITENSYYRWTFSCGPGTNTRAELLGACDTLHLATRLNIDHLQLVDDSKVIIDWLNLNDKLQSITLVAWMDQIKALQRHFKTFMFTHTSREFNREADLLSKTALQKQVGMITYTHWMDDHEGPSLAIKLF
jgi:ribonuclease HI